jgi:DNA-binding response OmpR family regulator
MKKLKILIVEDEKAFADGLKSQMEHLNHEVLGIAKSYDEAMKKIKKQKPNLILMDIMLQGSKNGIELTRDINTLHNDILIIYITGHNDYEIIEKAQNTKHIGFITKPLRKGDFKYVLYDAVRRIESPDHTPAKNLLELNHYYFFDNKNHELYYKDVLINTTSKEKEILNMLISNKNQYVDGQELESQVWDGLEICSNTLKKHISKLRKKTDYKFIETSFSKYKIEVK